MLPFDETGCDPAMLPGISQIIQQIQTLGTR
jgi:hypothetical protein